MTQSIPPITRLLLLILTDAGGEGKTMLALLLRALLDLVDDPAGFLDTDAGNYSAAMQLAGTDAAASLKVLRWGTSTNAVTRILDDHRGSHIIVDTGANMTASGREIGAMLPVLQQQAKEAGYRTVALLPMSPNKVGAAGALLELAKAYPRWEQLFVQVDRDHSSNFEPGLEVSRTVTLSHLAPGYQELIRKEGGLVNVVRSPPQGYDLAADAIASWMGDFAKQELIAGLLGSGPGAALASIGRKRPLRTRFQIARMSDAANNAITANARKASQMAILDSHHWGADGHREVIRRMEAGDI